MRPRVVLLVLAGVAVSGASAVRGQGIVTQWNFPTGFSTTSPAPSTGAGTASLIGGATGSSAGGLVNGGSTEAVSGSVAWNTASYPAQGTNSGTAGTQYLLSTAGAADIVFRYDQQNSATASRFFRLDYTLDGVGFLPGPIFENTLGANAWNNNRTVDLSGLTAAVENNANFGVRLVSIFAPSTSAYATVGTGSTYGTGGTTRIDAVTVTSAARFIGGSGTLLNTPANYATGNAPAATGTVVLSNSAGANTTVGVPAGGLTVAQVVFRAVAPSFTVNSPSSSTLTLTAGIANDATAPQSFTAPVTFGQSNAIQQVAGGQVTFDAAVGFQNYLNIHGGTTRLNSTTTGSISGITTGNPAAPTVRVSSGSTLAGIGTLAGTTAVSVLAGSTLAPGLPGATPGVFTTASPVLVPIGATYRVTLATGATPAAAAGVNTGTSSGGTPGAINSQLVTGANSITLNTGLTVALDLAGFSPNPVNTYSFIIGTSDTSVSNVAGTPAAFTFFNGTTDITSSITAQFTPSLGLGGANVYLNLVPVPEPATVLAVAAIGLGGLQRIRRRLTASSRQPA